MDIEGEARAPGRQHLMSVANHAGLPEVSCKTIIERIAAQALQFDTVAKGHPVRVATRKKVSKAITANLSRLR